MIAVQTIENVGPGPLIIDIPTDFYSHTVEVTVRLIKDVTKRQSTLQELLLDAPTLTDDELTQYQETREWMDQWQINEFL